MQHIYKKISFLFLLACVMLTPSAFVSADHTNAHTIETLQAQITSLMAQIADLQKRIADSTEGNGGSTRVPTIVPAVCPRFTYNFYLGMDDTETGGQVTELQNILAADSEIYPGALITGYYGPLTEQAVRRYQKRHSIVSSGSPDTTGYGVVGPATRGKLVQGCGQPAPIPGVVPLRASLKISSPNGGESWQMRSEQAVRWSSLESFSYVDVDLLSWSPPLPPCQECPAIASAPSFSAAILRRAPNTGYLSWRVGNILSDSIVPAGTYVIRVSNSENANVYDQSDSYFKIVQNGTNTNNPPVISGVSGPTTLNIDQQGTWTVKAYDRNGGNLVYSVVWGDEERMTGTGSNSGVPASAKTQQTATFTHSYSQVGIYMPMFFVTNNNDNIDGTAKTSLSVNVGNNATPSITVLSPNGGESYAVGTTIPISFSTTLTDKQTSGITMQLYRGTPGAYDSSFVQTIVSNWIGGSPYQWQIPATLTPGQYSMYVSALTPNMPLKEGGVSDWSDAPFTIIPTVTPKQSITVLSPSGGEIWKIGNKYTIQWVPGNIEVVTVQLFKGGNPVYRWDPPYSFSSIEWRIQDSSAFGELIPGNDYKIRVNYRTTEWNTAFDESDAPFSIVGESSIRPDLTITDLRLDPPSPVVNQQAKLSYTIKNIGSSHAAFVLGKTFSTGLSFSLISSNCQPLLGAGESCSVVDGVTGNQTGSSFVTVHVTTDGGFLDVNENNNSANLGFNVSTGNTLPDLTVSNISFSSANPKIGDIVKINYEVKNIGNKDIYDPFWMVLKVNGQYNSAEKKVSYTSVPVLAAGASITLSNLDYRIPASGVYNFSVTADGVFSNSPTSLITESNENNNTLEKNITF